MKTDLEKIERLIGSLGLDVKIHTKENKIEMAIYDYDKLLCSAYFNLDGSLITCDLLVIIEPDGKRLIKPLTSKSKYDIMLV